MLKDELEDLAMYSTGKCICEHLRNLYEAVEDKFTAGMTLKYKDLYLSNYDLVYPYFSQIQYCVFILPEKIDGVKAAIEFSIKDKLEIVQVEKFAQELRP